MFSRSTVLGLTIILVASIFIHAQTREADRKGAEMNPFSGKALFVQMRGQPADNVFLEEPSIQTLGGLSFLVGQVVNEQQRAWLPLVDVARIEEFANREELSKRYRLGEAGSR